MFDIVDTSSKTTMVFSGEQQNMAQQLAENIKKTKLVDFRVWKQKH